MKKIKTAISIYMFLLSLKLLGVLLRLSRTLRKEILNPGTGFVFNAKSQNEIPDKKVDGVLALADPNWGKYSIDDFPRLKYLKNRRFALRPAIRGALHGSG